MILIASTEFGTELSDPRWRSHQAFRWGGFQKKELQFPGGTRLEQSQGITEVVGAFLPGSFHGFHRETTNPIVPRARHACARAPRARCGRGRPGRRGAGSKRAVWRLQTSAPFKAESFPGRTRSFCSAIPYSLLRWQKAPSGVTALFLSLSPSSQFFRSPLLLAREVAEPGPRGERPSPPHSSLPPLPPAPAREGKRFARPGAGGEASGTGGAAPQASRLRGFGPQHLVMGALWDWSPLRGACCLRRRPSERASERATGNPGRGPPSPARPLPLLCPGLPPPGVGARPSRAVPPPSGPIPPCSAGGRRRRQRQRRELSRLHLGRILSPRSQFRALLLMTAALLLPQPYRPPLAAGWMRTVRR
jgi:hypothetical protein